MADNQLTASTPSTTSTPSTPLTRMHLPALPHPHPRPARRQASSWRTCRTHADTGVPVPSLRALSIQLQLKKNRPLL
jgi:hypothetical protein